MRTKCDKKKLCGGDSVFLDGEDRFPSGGTRVIWMGGFPVSPAQLVTLVNNPPIKNTFPSQHFPCLCLSNIISLSEIQS